VSAVDILPTLLAVAGLPPEPVVRGRSLLGLFRGEETAARSAVYAESAFLQGNRYYPQRAIRTDRYKYIRNLRPDLDFVSNSLEIWGLPMLVAWDSNPRARFLLERNVRHPREELYDLAADPDELSNVAGDPAHAAALADLRGRLRDHLAETADPWLVLWDDGVPVSDPFEPEETKDGRFEGAWLEQALRDPQLIERYERRFPMP